MKISHFFEEEEVLWYTALPIATFLINKYNANAYAVGEKIENLNILNDFNVEMAKKPFSVQSIESRNNFNFNKSSSLNIERNELIDRYLND